MTKYIGAAAIALAFILAAACIYTYEKDKLNALRALSNSLASMRGELCERLTPINALSERLGSIAEHRSIKGFYYTLGERTRLCDEPFYAIWNRTAKEELSLLGVDVIREILPLGETLGRSDVSAVLASIDACRKTLDERSYRLASLMPERTRLVFGISLSAGAFILILLA